MITFDDINDAAERILQEDVTAEITDMESLYASFELFGVETEAIRRFTEGALTEKMVIALVMEGPSVLAPIVRGVAAASFRMGMVVQEEIQRRKDAEIAKGNDEVTTIAAEERRERALGAEA